MFLKKMNAVLIAASLVAMVFSGCGSGAQTGDSTTTPPPATEQTEQSETKASDESKAEAPAETPTKTATEPVKVDGGSLIRPMPSDISSLNILYETGDEGMTMLKPVYDPLYIVGKDEVRYYLAESREVSEDGLSITVKLRDQLKWHDGEPITADDVIFNFEFRMNPDNKTSSGTKVNGELISVEKIDDLTFKVTLPSVSASYDSTLGGMKLLPKHIYEGEANISTSEKNMLGIGSGPYKVQNWNKGESLILERFDEYYRGKPSLETVVFKIMPNESAQEIALQNGEINFYRISTQDKLEKFSKDDRYETVSISEGRINYMGFNSNSELMKNKTAREAIAKALNVDEIIAGAYGSEEIAAPAKTVFCPENFYYSDVDGYHQDLEAAKSLIEESGLAGQTLKLVYNSSRPNMEDCALIIQQQLKNVGINVEITGYETQGFFEKFFYTDLGDWDLGLNGYSTNSDNQGDEYMFSSEGFLSKNLCTNDEIAALWNEGDATTDPAKRAEIYKQLQEKIRDEYTMFPISNPNFIMAVDKNLKGCDAIQVVPVFEDYTQLYMVQ